MKNNAKIWLFKGNLLLKLAFLYWPCMAHQFPERNAANFHSALKMHALRAKKGNCRAR